MKRQWTKPAAMMVVLMLIAVDCAPRATPFPIGTFTFTFALGGADPHMVEFKSDGTYVYQYHRDVAKGTYIVTGNQVVFQDDLCGGVKGTYTWAFDGKALSFKALDDGCSSRLGVLDNIKWEKKP